MRRVLILVRRVRLVDGSKIDSPLDPLTAAPARSAFLKSVILFLRKDR